MQSLYRCLLYLYPADFRSEFGDEMLRVFSEAQGDAKAVSARVAFFLREVAGLLHGAAQERLRELTGSHSIGPISSFSPSTSRRFTMRPGFRFPKSTAVLMAIILAGVLLTIEKAQSIVRGTAQSDYPDLVGGLVAIFVAAGVLAAVSWAVLFAVRRSGVHRLSQMPAEHRKDV